MGKRGPPPLPTALKLLRGNPGHRPLATDEPKPRGRATCPEWVCDPGKELWAHLAPDLEREGLLTARSAAEFGAYCHERAIYAVYSDLLKGIRPRSIGRIERYRSLALKAQREALRLGAKFGMTPSDQVGLTVPQKPKGQDEEFLFGHRRSES